MSLETDGSAPLVAATNPQATREMLALKRESVCRVGDSAAIHLDLALGCVAVADDIGLSHHMAFAVNHMRALAKLVNDLSATRNEIAT
jgi:hypothetical protein